MKIYYINGWSSSNFEKSILDKYYHNCFLCNSEENLKYILFYLDNYISTRYSCANCFEQVKISYVDINKIEIFNSREKLIKQFKKIDLLD